VYHKRVPFTRKPWVQTFSRDTRYRLILTAGGPAFSPAGDRFAFVGPGTAGKGAGVGIGTPGSETTEVIYKDPARNILGPQWSPDGGGIIFGVGEFAAFFNGFHSEFMQPADRTEGGAQIAIVNADGSGYREVTKGPNNNGFPWFAPDGERFVYRTFGPEGDGLRITDLRTGTSTMLSKGYDNFPLWSPRGDLIMFSGQVDGDYEIYTIKPDGTGLKRLTTSRGNDAHMAWSPDGSHIVFTSTRMGFKDEAVYTDAPQPYGEIFVMRFDGTDLQQITDNQWEEGTPAWHPAPPPPHPTSK
jgi:Tol biopolymer transport system component